MPSSRRKVAWSPGDRLLVIVLSLTLTLALGLFLRSRTQDQMPVVLVPTPVLPSSNAFDYYVRAGNAVVGGAVISPSTPNPPALPTAAQDAVVQQNVPAIALLHQGFQYPCHGPVSRSFSAPFPQYAKLRGLARLLGLQARVNAARSDWAGAMTADLDCLRMGEDIARGSGLIGMLVGAACEGIGRRHAWQQTDHLTAAQARASAQRLEGIRFRHVPFSDTLREEKWQNQAGLLELMARPDWPGGFGDRNTSGSSDSPLTDTLAHWKTASTIRLLGKRRIMANYTGYMDQWIADARQPYAAHPLAPTPPDDPVNQTMFFDLNSLRITEVKADTENALLLTLLALRAYRVEHGAYPATLSALAPTYLEAAPGDPFALAGPLRYKRVGSRFAVYSVGPDGKDDGGKPIFDAAKTAPKTTGSLDARYAIQPDSQGDVVAGVNIY